VIEAEAEAKAEEKVKVGAVSASRRKESVECPEREK
jgi:hypothetical protein